MPWKEVPSMKNAEKGDEVKQYINIEIPEWVTPSILPFMDRLADWLIENVFDSLAEITREVNEEITGDARVDVRDVQGETIVSGERYRLVFHYTVLRASPIAFSTIALIFISIIATFIGITILSQGKTFVKTAGQVATVGVVLLAGFFILTTGAQEEVEERAHKAVF